MKNNKLMSCTILMTACIDPSAGKIKVQRSDPEIRLKDYIIALEFWLNIDDARLRNIVFVDNSAYPLDSLIATASKKNKFNKTIEFISLDCNDYPEGVHYGYGELKMIDSAFNRSKVLHSSSHFLKATGRLTFPDISKLLDYLSADQLFSVDCRRIPFLEKKYHSFVTTQLMIFSTNFYKENLIDLKSCLNKKMTHIESIFFERLIPFDGVDGVMLRWPINVNPVGEAAHWKKNYSSKKQRFYGIIRGYFRRLLPFFWI